MMSSKWTGAAPGGRRNAGVEFDGAGVGRPGSEDRAFFGQGEVGVLDDVGWMLERLRRMQQGVEIKHVFPGFVLHVPLPFGVCAVFAGPHWVPARDDLGASPCAFKGRSSETLMM